METRSAPNAVTCCDPSFPERSPHEFTKPPTASPDRDVLPSRCDAGAQVGVRLRLQSPKRVCSRSTRSSRWSTKTLSCAANWTSPWQGIVERLRASGEAMPAMNLIERQVLERLILRELQVQRALQTGIRVSDTDIDQALVTLAQQNNMSVQRMREVIEADGEDFAEFRRNIGEELLTERLRQRIVNGMAPIIRYRGGHPARIGGSERRRIQYFAHHGSITRRRHAAADPAGRGQGPDDIHRRLGEGLDFASAAISYSDSQEALEGGEVGWRDLNSIPAFFADAIRDLQTRDSSRRRSAAPAASTSSRSTITASSARWWSRSITRGTSWWRSTN
jgi:hypothetical protein